MTTRKPGRPKGASRLNRDDEVALAKMADLIVANPNMKPTTAMHRIGINDDTVEHRLRRKWNTSSERHLAVARQRQQPRADVGRSHITALSVARAVQTMTQADIEGMRKAAKAVQAAHTRLEQQFGKNLNAFLDSHRTTAQQIIEATRKLNQPEVKAAIDFVRSSQNTNLAAALRGDDLFKVPPLGSGLPPRKD